MFGYKVPKQERVPVGLFIRSLDIRVILEAILQIFFAWSVLFAICRNLQIFVVIQLLVYLLFSTFFLKDIIYGISTN